jgi:signal transduction histidine kinase
MRRRLALLVLAVTAMVTIAFLVPLAVVVRVVARDRALSAADQESRTLAGLMAAISSPGDVDAVVAQLNTDSPRRAAVFLSDGTRIGAPVELPDSELELARTGRAFTSSSPHDERHVVVPVRNSDGSVTVTVVAVPESLLREGVASAWLVLGGIGVVLVLLGVVLADRLARSMVVAIEDLQSGTARLQRGELTARIDPRGPPEIAAVGRTVNALADRIDELLAAERESVADLSHRLRTPLAALQLEADGVQPAETRQLLQDRIDRVARELDTVITQMRRPRAPTDATCDIDAVVRDRLDFWAVLAEDQARAWTYSGPDAPLAVPLGSDEAAAAVDAMLGNIFAHTPDGTNYRVWLRAGDEAVLVVEDDGPGVPAGADERGASGGDSTGLGLDIVRRTAERSGGSLVIDGRSSTGGARVIVRLGRVRQRPRR